MNAEEAKAKALAAKKQAADSLEVKKNDLFSTQVNLLLNEINKKIELAVNAGKLQIEKLTYPDDRFSNEVVTAVAEKLRDDGYNFHMAKHNALHTTDFMVSWV